MVTVLGEDAAQAKSQSVGEAPCSFDTHLHPFLDPMARTKQTVRKSQINIATGVHYRTLHGNTDPGSGVLRAHDTNRGGLQWWKEKQEIKKQEPTIVKVQLDQIDSSLVTQDDIQRILDAIPEAWRLRGITITGDALKSSKSALSASESVSVATSVANGAASTSSMPSLSISTMLDPSSTTSSSSSSSSSVHNFELRHEQHIYYPWSGQQPVDTVVERPKRKQRLYEQQVSTRFVPVDKNGEGEDAKLVPDSSDSSSSSDSNSIGGVIAPYDITTWTLKRVRQLCGQVIEEFLRACMAQPDVHELLSIDPQRAAPQFDHPMAIHPSQSTPFIVALLQAHKEADSGESMVECLYQPYRTQLKSFIRRASTELTLDYGTATPNCTLLQYVIYSWTINNTDHLAYDWLCGLLETPNYPIDALDCHGESALSSWSRNEHVVNGLVFHKLIQAGARTDRIDAFDRSWMFHLLDLGQYNLIRSLLRHGYEHLCLDAFMHCARRSDFLNPQNSVWSERIDHEEKEYQSDEIMIKKAQIEKEEKRIAMSKRRARLPPESEESEHEDENEDIDERQLNRVNDDGPERVMVEMRRTWRQKYQPYILNLLISPSQNDDAGGGGCGIISDCAQLCLQYLDGSGKPWFMEEKMSKKRPYSSVQHIPTAAATATATAAVTKTTKGVEPDSMMMEDVIDDDDL